MTTQNPIYVFQDLLDALETQPDLRQATLQHLLTGEMLNLPTAVASMAASMATMQKQMESLAGQVGELTVQAGNLEAGQESMKASQERMEASQKRMESNLGNIREEKYERKIANIAENALRQQAGIQNARKLQTPNQTGDELRNLLDNATNAGLITSEQAEGLQSADIIAIGEGHDGEPRYALVEISITADQGDVDRAAQHAAILKEATQTPVTPVVICARIPETNRGRAAASGVTIIYRDE